MPTARRNVITLGIAGSLSGLLIGIGASLLARTAPAQDRREDLSAEVEASLPSELRRARPTREEPGARSGRAAALRAALPPPSEATVPEPTGYRIGLALGYKPQEIYNAEVRNPAWAGSMETQLAALLRNKIAMPYRGVKLADVECRATTCRLAIEYSEETARTIFPDFNPERSSVLSKVLWHVGPLASFSDQEEDDDPGRETVVLAFSEEEIDPARHAAWAEKKRLAAWKRYEEKMKGEAK